MPVRHDGIEDNETCSRSLLDLREALLYTRKTVWRSYDNRTTVTGRSFDEIYQTYNLGLNPGNLGI